MPNHIKLIIGGVALLLAACGGSSDLPDAAYSEGEALGTVEPSVLATAQAQSTVEAAGDPARMPRADRLSAADVEPEQGVDFCDAYPEPAPATYTPQQAFREIKANEVAYGDAAVPVQLVMYATPDCTACWEVWDELKAQVDDNPETIKAYLRLVPADAFTTTIVEAAFEAREQGGIEGFDGFYTQVSENISAWADAPEADFVPLLKAAFREAGLNGDALEAALDAGTHTAAVEALAEETSQLTIQTYPVILINDYGMAQDTINRGADVYVPYLWQFIEAARLELAYPEPPPMVIDESADYGAWILTPEGTLALDLFANLAPQTVNNFAYLSCVGFYDDNQFHRVIPSFVAQGGDPSGSSFGGVGYLIPDEYQNSDLEFDQRGWLSMAKRSEPDTASSQFFITLDPTPNLDQLGFTIFGELVAGDDVLANIEPRQPGQAVVVLPPGTTIETIIVRQLTE